MAISEEKLQLYIVAIVGVVAAVGILVLLMNTNVETSTTDMSGQVYIPAGHTCCAWVAWEDGTNHCISYAKVCPRRKL